MKKLFTLVWLLAAASVSWSGDAPPSFSPETDQSRTLGSAEKRWGTVYTTGIDDGQGNSINVAETAQYVGDKNHNALTVQSRSAANSHPIDAITGLSGILQPATQASDGLMSAADKTKIDNADFDGFVKHTPNGDIQLPQGNAYLGTDGGSNAVTLSRVDENNDAAFGDIDHYSRLYSAGRPFILTPNPDDPASPLQDNMAYMSDIEDVVRYDAGQGITLSAGSGISVLIPGTYDPDTGAEITPPVVNPIYQTDALGNVHLGNASAEWNITAIQRPTIQIGGGAPVGIGVLTDLDTFVSEEDLATELAGKADLVSGTIPYAQLPADLATAVTEAALATALTAKADLVSGTIPYSQLPADLSTAITEAELAGELAYKADLVGGSVPTSQMPPGAIPKNYTVDEEADLTGLTTAITNDRALVKNVAESGPEEIWLLWNNDPTVAANWQNITATAEAAPVASVNGMTGAVTIDLANLPNVQNALNDKANASSLANYGVLSAANSWSSQNSFNGGLLSAPPASTANSNIVPTTAWVNTKLGAYATLAGTQTWSGENTFSGPVYVPTVAQTIFDSTAASTSWTTTKLASYAPLASPNLTGLPTVPTAAITANNTQAANTAYVKSNLANYLPLTGGTISGTATTFNNPNAGVIHFGNSNADWWGRIGVGVTNYATASQTWGAQISLRNPVATSNTPTFYVTQDDYASGSLVRKNLFHYAGGNFFVNNRNVLSEIDAKLPLSGGVMTGLLEFSTYPGMAVRTTSDNFFGIRNITHTGLGIFAGTGYRIAFAETMKSAGNAVTFPMGYIDKNDFWIGGTFDEGTGITSAGLPIKATLNTKANLVSPYFSGTPTTSTPAAGSVSGQIASTIWVDARTVASTTDITAGTTNLTNNYLYLVYE